MTDGSFTESVNLTSTASTTVLNDDNSDIVIPVTIGAIVFALLHVIPIVVIVIVCTRRKRSRSPSLSNGVSHVNVESDLRADYLEADALSLRVPHFASLRRLSKNSMNNDYSLLHANEAQRNMTNQNGYSRLKVQKNPSPSSTIAAGENENTKHEYDSLSQESGEDNAYDYVRDNDADYDYESPYWLPSSDVGELLEQFRKLKIHGISSQNIKEGGELGSGAFGTVNRARWLHKEEDASQTTEEEVAVKSIEGGASDMDRIKFLQEAAIMGQFNHPNIVKILGIMLKADKCKIIMELMEKGNLRDHLPTLKSRYQTPAELSSQLLYYSRQVASGMSYLCIKGYVHRDLAARNVLVSRDDVCKIGDFGLSRDLQKEEFYMGHGGMIPIKWTAPEALHYHLYSQASDIWSYGCVLYEIWSLGMKPYNDLSNAQVIDKLATGYRLPPPPGCPRAIYDIMIKSWNTDTDSRPGFYDICLLLNLPDIRILQWSEEDLARYGEEARTIGAPLEAAEHLFAELQETYYSTS